MHKLRLKLDELAVESFSIDQGMQNRGTVRAGSDTDYDTCRGQATCGGQNTCWDSCDGICGSWFCATDPSCAESCINSCAVSACGANCQPSYNDPYSCGPTLCGC